MAVIHLNLEKIIKGLEDAETLLKDGKAFTPALNYLGNKAVRYAKEYTSKVSGNMKRSWYFKRIPGRNAVLLHNRAYYAPYVDLGHRLKRGKKTIGFVAPQHMVAKSLKVVGKNDMAKAVDMVFKEVFKVIRK